jgi:cation transport ATPase
MRDEKVIAYTVLARIVQMVVEVQHNREPIQRLTDIVTGCFIQLVLAIAFLNIYHLKLDMA